MSIHQSIQTIFYIVSITMPAYFIECLFLLRKYSNFHAFLKEGCGFLHVDDLKSNILIQFFALYPEIKPLGIAKSVGIILQ